MEYKGFNIEFSNKNNRFYFGEWIPGAGFHDADGCSEAGYATESAAKVAITKYLKQQECSKADNQIAAEHSAGNRALQIISECNATPQNEWTEEDQREQDYFDRWPDNFTEKTVKATFSENYKDFLIKANEEINNIEINPPTMLPSRNVREGFFSGLYNGGVKRLPMDTYHDGAKYVWSNSDEPKNRKQRKIMKIYQKRNKALFNYLVEENHV